MLVIKFTQWRFKQKGKKLWFSSVSFKLWLTMVTLVLLVLGSFSFALNVLFKDFYIQQKVNSLEQEAKEISAVVNSVRLKSELQSELNTFRYTQGTMALVLDDSGQVLAYTMGIGRMGMGGMGGIGGLHGLAINISQSDLAKAIGGETIWNTVDLQNNVSAVLVATQLKLAGGEFTGALILTSPLEPITESVNSFSHMLYYIMAIALVLATLFALWLSRTLTTPLVGMDRVASRMSSGDFSHRVNIQSEDELGDLGKSLNKLAEDLDRHTKLLSREKEQLNGILASMGDAVVTLDNNGSLVQANPPAQDLWQDQAERKDIILEHLRHALSEVNQSGQPVYKDVELGTQVLGIHMEPLKEVEGQGGGVAVLRDVTAGRKQEKLRRELMASVSHELRTPIHLIQGQVEALADGLVPKQEQRQYLDMILREVHRLGRLVGDLQEINRLEHGFSIVQDRLNLGLLAREVGEKFGPRAEIENIDLQVVEEPVWIFGDRDRLTQVLANLLDNAMRYTPPGGNIKIRVYPSEDNAVMVVRDSGKGIDPENLPYIWESFFKVESSGKSHMGLGLTIVKRIIEAHGGQITAASEQEKGTTFTITIPRCKEL